MHIACIGGAAINLTGVPNGVLRLRDSNIGAVQETIGGVAHNIACHLAVRGHHTVEMVTAVGTDEAGDTIIKDCQEHGLLTDRIFRFDGPSARYMSILDGDRDLLAGISDMSLIERLGAEEFRSILPQLKNSDAVLLDANLSPEALEFLTDAFRDKPIFYEPVSRSKSVRIGKNIGKCYAVKPNRFEAQALTGCSCDSIGGAFRATEKLLSAGVKHVYISMGSEGIVYGDETGYNHLEAEPIKAIDTAGAGDIMYAQIIIEALEGKNALECAKAGNHASALWCSGAFRG